MSLAVVCDCPRCGGTSGPLSYDNSLRELYHKAKALGWESDEEGKDWCPECVKRNCQKTYKDV